MPWKLSRSIEAILQKSADGGAITQAEALTLLRIENHTREAYALMQTAHDLSRRRFAAKGELHFHIGLNVEPCPMDCRFCSLTKTAGIFKGKTDFSKAEILAWAKQGEDQGADALNLMTTGTYPFTKLLSIGRLLHKEVSIPLVANTRDINHGEAEQLIEAGFIGCYHAVRLGEGKDTPFDKKRRIQTIDVIKDVGLQWMNCIEPVGPEHSCREIVDLMFLARDKGATYSGVMRRINFPGSPMAPFGMINDLTMAKLVAVSRLVMGNVAKAHCTHEPHEVSLLAGANLFFPETGASPRDDTADTGKGRGVGIPECRRLLQEMDWNPDSPSNCFAAQ